MATAIANALDKIVYGGKPSDPDSHPWLGSMRSVTPDQVPPEYIASINSTTPSNNFIYIPRTGTWKLRGGSAVLFDTFGSLVGLLPDKWAADPHASSLGARIRHQEEFVSDSVTDGIPTVLALTTRETVPSGLLDDGRFSNAYIRDQVNNVHYTIGDEFSTTITYPAVGSTQTFRYVPLWYDSGDGGITRGVSEQLRRFLFCGSRRFLKVGNWWYFPSVLGTPSRWRGRFLSGNANSGITTSAMAAAGAWTDQAGGTTNLHTVIDEFPASDADYVKVDVNAGGQVSLELDLSTPSPLPSSSTPHTIQFRYRRTGGSGTGPGLVYTFYKGNEAVTIKSATLANLEVTTSWTDYSYTLSAAEVASLANTGTGGGAYNLMSFFFNWTGAAGAAGSEIQVSMLRVSFGNTLTTTTLADNANYLFPTGPFPPTHCGTVTANSPVTAEYQRPDAMNSAGSWTNQSASALNLHLDIDEATADDTDYVHTTTNTDTLDVGLGNFTSTPTTADTVTIRVRARRSSLFGQTINVRFQEGATIRAQTTINPTTSWANYSYSLTSTEISSVGTWNNTKMVFISGILGGGEVFVSQAYMELLPAAITSEGGWKGKDRFMRACYGVFEDGSKWALTQPRFANSTLTAGLDLITVDSSNPEVPYQSITHTNLPILPPGFTHLGLCRTDKIDSTSDDDLQINPTGMKFIAEVPNGTTSYIDYAGDDAALALDVEQYFIRYDHIMAPRTRYLAGGDMRVVASCGGSSPCAIVIAPIGRTSDYDLNLAADSSTLYTSNASYMQVSIATDATGTLTLIQSDAATATNTKTFAFATYDTLQKLVDGINSTSCAVDGQQWRAQLCPGASPDASPATALTPHNRAIASCVVDNTAKTITKAAGGLSKVAVGQLVSGASEEAGAYVTQIVSDTSLVYTGTLTTGVETLYFYNNLGDPHITDPDTSALGFQRVIANSLPGFLYFNKTYLDTQTFDKAATWMTVASPGSVKAAPNCFSGKLSNRFTPPLEAGICQGGAAVDHGFVILYGNKVGAIRPRGPDSFLDREYGLVIIDETRGCSAWNTITPGNRFVPFMSAEGIFAADLFNVKLLSEYTYVDQPVATGDFSYEGPRCVAATAMDVDVYNADTTVGAYAWARIARGILFVGYRSGGSGGTTHCDRLVRLDFTSGDDSTGIPALFRRNGVPWGWSTPLLGSSSGASAIYRYAMLCEVRRSDGFHLYGWNEENGGTTGDGRLDEIETGTTDPSSTAITGRVEMPWLRPPDSELVSGQEMILEHSSPTGSTGSLVFHRTFSDDSYTLTPGTSALGVYSEMKLLPFNTARANANAVYVDYRQATGSARELRRLVLKFKRVQRFKT